MRLQYQCNTFGDKVLGLRVEAAHLTGEVTSSTFRSITTNIPIQISFETTFFEKVTSLFGVYTLITRHT